MKTENNPEILQIPTCGNDLENLAVLENLVWEEIKKQCANIDRSIFRFRFLYQLSQTTVALLLFLVSWVIILPSTAAEVVKFISEQLPLRGLEQGFWLLSLFIWAGGGVVFLLPIFLSSYRVPRKWIFGIHLYIWQPFCIAMALAITPLSEFTWEKVTGGFLGIIIVVVAGSVGIIGFLFLIRGLIVQNVSFLLTLISLKEPVFIQDKQEEIFPDKAKLAHNVISTLQPQLNNWSRTTWKNISLLIAYKSTEGGLQTQYASFILAALALLGLLPIIIPNGVEIIFTKTASLLGIFSSQSGGSVKAEDIQWIFVFLLTLLVIGTIYYFIRMYQTSYVHEIIKFLSLTEQSLGIDEVTSSPSMKNKEISLTTTDNLSSMYYWFMSIVLTVITIFFYDRIKSENR